jgi:hypothetical protein
VELGTHRWSSGRVGDTCDKPAARDDGRPIWGMTVGIARLEDKKDEAIHVCRHASKVEP